MVEERTAPDLEIEWLVNQIAHALRNPIFAALVQVDALSLRSALQPEAKRAVETLQRQLKRLEETINEMLLFGRPAQLTRTPVDVDELVATIAEAYRRAPRPEPAVVTVCPAGCGLRASWDAGAIRIILVRLLDNAIQHTKPPHEVEVRVEPGSDGHVTLAVCDRGEGIPDDLRDRVLLPFFPQHRGRPGLGLAVANRFCDLLGGRLSIDSRPGTGTEVRVSLPCDPPAPTG
jgi:two-component system, NtrC family, sensor histidine kinase HydH